MGSCLCDHCRICFQKQQLSLGFKHQTILAPVFTDVCFMNKSGPQPTDHTYNVRLTPIAKVPREPFD